MVAMDLTEPQQGSWIRHGLSEQESEAEGMLSLIAGSETTASVMRVTLLCLISSPPAYNKLKDAVREAVKSGTVTEPISYAEAREIPYLRVRPMYPSFLPSRGMLPSEGGKKIKKRIRQLSTNRRNKKQAVVFEGMRMRPGATGTFSKIVPPQGEVVQGNFIPGGTVIAMNVPAMQRSTEVFGPDVHLFRPERWLEATEAKQGEMERQLDMMFGSGRWMCAGKPIALMELFKTFFEVSLAYLFPAPPPPNNNNFLNVDFLYY
jgi:cytochrome P450